MDAAMNAHVADYTFIKVSVGYMGHDKAYWAQKMGDYYNITGLKKYHYRSVQISPEMQRYYTEVSKEVAKLGY